MKKNLPSILVLVLIATMWAVSCKKDPTPAPTPDPTPTDTIAPVTPDDTIVPGDTIMPPTPGGDTLPPMIGGTKEYLVDFSPSAGGAVLPSLDSVQEWARIFDTIFLRVRATSDAWTPNSFHVVRDSLAPRFDISSKVRGKGWWLTYQILDDDQVNNIGVMGMIRSDSAYFADKGYGIYPQVTGKNAKSVQPSR